MRVLLTTDVVGGVWTYALTLAGALVERGHACALAVIGDPSPAQVAAIPEGVHWETASYRLEWDRASESDVSGATRWLETLARQWMPDVVHLNQFAYGTGAFDAPTVVVAHSDVLSWLAEVRGETPGPEWAPYGAWVRAGLRAADMVVAPTCYQSALLGRHYGRAADRVIPNGMAVPPDSERSPSRRASERSLVLAAGRAWDEAKGIAVLDEALERLGGRGPSVHLAGALDGPGGERFRPSKLHAHGRLSREAMNRLYGNAAVYVATSRYEPFGLAPLEAAMHGCALVLSDIGSFRELWQGAAEFVPVGDPVALGEALMTLLDDPARLDGLAAAARSRAREGHEVASMVAGYTALYSELIQAGAAHARQSA